MKHLYLKILVVGFLLITCFASCSNLRKEEIAKIRFETSGCFGTSDRTIIFFKNENEVFAKLLANKKIQKTTIVSTEQFKSLEQIIFKIKQLEKGDGNCTSRRMYTVHTINENIKRIDDNCIEIGFYALETDLFEISN